MPPSNLPRAGHQYKTLFSGVSAAEPGERGMTAKALQASVADGGFTMAPDGTPATTGYSVGQKGTTGVTRADTALTSNGNASIHSFNDMSQWHNRHRGSVAAAGHLGGWNNSQTGNIVFNATNVIPDRTTAIAEGGPSKQDQISVFHLDTFNEIPTGGKGDEERNY